MQLGTQLAKHQCARCGQPLTIPAHCQDGEYYHRSCWEQVLLSLANAERIAREVQPTLFIHEGVMPL